MKPGQENQEFLGYLLASNKLYELSDPEAVIQALTTLEEPPSRPLIESCRTQGELQHGAVTPVERIPEEPQDKEEGVGEGSTPPDDDTESVDIRESIYDDDDEESRDGLGEPHEDTPPRKEGEGTPDGKGKGRAEKRRREEEDDDDESLWKRPRSWSPETTSPFMHPTMRLFPLLSGGTTSRPKGKTGTGRPSWSEPNRGHARPSGTERMPPPPSVIQGVLPHDSPCYVQSVHDLLPFIIHSISFSFPIPVGTLQLFLPVGFSTTHKKKKEKKTGRGGGNPSGKGVTPPRTTGAAPPSLLMNRPGQDALDPTTAYATS